MAYNSTLSIDELIKRIYKSYIEIKTGDFREIERDMLLNDISHLYTSIKEYFPSDSVGLPIIDIETEIKKENSSEESIVQAIIQPIENTAEVEIAAIESLETTKNQQIPPDIVEEKNISHTEFQENETTINETDEATTTVDLTMFGDDDDDDFDIPTITSTTETEVEKKVEERIIEDKRSDNKNSPFVQQFFGILKDKQETVIPIIEEDTKSSPVEITNEVPIPEPEVKNEIMPEPEKRSADKIIDFLKHEERSEKKDIYGFLDINTRIGLVEMFFKGNSLELTECLVKINQLSTKEECIKVMDKYAVTFGVKDTDDIYQQFLNLIERKFQYN